MTQDNSNQRGWRIFTIILSAVIIAACAWFICSHLSGNNNETKPDDTTFSVAANNNADIKIVMIDGSQIWIRNGSRINYSSTFTADRTVTLVGDAFFSVSNTAQTPFRVIAGNLTITSEEAEFKVITDTAARQITIIPDSGTAWVSVGGGATKNLKPGEQFILNVETNSAEIENLPSGKLNEWRSEKLNFRLMTLSEIFDSLSGLYNIPFEFDRAQMGGDRFSIKLNGSENLTEVMQIVAAISGRIDYTIDPGVKVIIISNK